MSPRSPRRYRPVQPPSIWPALIAPRPCGSAKDLHYYDLLVALDSQTRMDALTACGEEAGPCSILLLSDFGSYASDARLSGLPPTSLLDRGLASFVAPRLAAARAIRDISLSLPPSWAAADEAAFEASMAALVLSCVGLVAFLVDTRPPQR